MTNISLQDITIVIIDDDSDVLESYRHLLSLSGYKVKCFSSPHRALEFITADFAGVILCDIYMPEMNGMDVLLKCMEVDPELPVMMITGHGDIPLAVNAMTKGASDFIEKPINPPLLLEKIKTISQQRVARLNRKYEIKKSLKKSLLGNSPQINVIREQVSLFSQMDKDILIAGEPGSGKNTVAELLLELSARHEHPQLIFNAVIHDDFEQFKMQIKQCAYGSCLIISPEQLSLPHQQWLIMFLLENDRAEVKKLRFIFIIQHDADCLLQQGALLPELYYFLSQFRITLPALRNRKRDIRTLFIHFVKRSCLRLGKETPEFIDEYIYKLEEHTWHNNIRELKHVAELYAIGMVDTLSKQADKSVAPVSGDLDEMLNDYERKLLEDALFIFSGKITETANHLGIPRKKLYLKMKKHNLDKNAFKAR